MDSWGLSPEAEDLFKKMNETSHHINDNIKPYSETVSPRKYGFSYDNAVLSDKTENLFNELKT